MSCRGRIVHSGRPARRDWLRVWTVLLLGALIPAGRPRLYTNRWAVRIPGGPGAADRVADKYGFLNMGQIGNLEDHYHFLHHRTMKRSTLSSRGNHSLIAMETSVKWVQQQMILHRKKRDRQSANFNDPKWEKMWYIHCDQNCLTDMNIKGAWNKGYTGKGVVVSILDDGIERQHPDLKQNYDSRASWDFNTGDPDPTPRYDATNENKHGTRCAGVVAAAANNSHCMVGIAYNARVGGVRMLDGDMTDMLEAQSLSLQQNYIDIYSSSWGPDDDGKTVDGPGPLAHMALENGIRKGRKGRGSIFVWASGNGGRNKDHCSCDGYTNSIYTISVSSTTQSGLKPWYLEECASTLATTYSSGDVTTDLRLRCTESHSGTSASAPMAAGIIALALEANPLLTWRDVQHIIVKTSRPGHLSAPDWQTNGAGHDVSHLYGFGLMDAEAMVKEAEKWTQVPAHRVCMESVTPSKRSTHTSDGCSNQVVFLEHVTVVVSLTHPRRGDLSIMLISPSGTRSHLLSPRAYDHSTEGFRKWKLMTTHCWGETAAGDWILEVRDNPLRRRGTKMIEWYLILYGTSVDPYPSQHRVHPRSAEADGDDYSDEYNGPCHTECNKDGCEGPGPHQCLGCLHFYLFKNNTRTCVSKCPAGYLGDRNRCKRCHFSCKTCEGSRSDQCTSCKNGHHLTEDTKVCVPSCGDGYYTDHDSNMCRKCSENCLRCTSFNICTDCKEDTSLVGNKCLKNCGLGSYYDEQQGSCEPCDPACATCAGVGVKACKSCAEGYLMEDWKCVSSCTSGFYAAKQNTGRSEGSRVCRRCDASCLSCVGPGRRNCSSCEGGHTLQDGMCVISTDCKDGEYQDTQRKCHSCDITCQKCRGPKNGDCIDCPSSRFLDDGQCVMKCPLGKFQANSQCHLCDHTCAECVDRGPANCTSCDTDKFGLDRYLLEGQCVDACPEAHFHTQQKTCEACPEHCQQCNSATHCLTCSPSYYPNQGVCVRQECGEGEPDYDGCMSCEEGCKKCAHFCGVRFEDGCYKNCPAKTYSVEADMTCVSCDQDCVSCDEHECYWCESDLFLSDGKCVLECPEGFYIKEDSRDECEACHSTCESCSGPQKNQCDSCSKGLYIILVTEGLWFYSSYGDLFCCINLKLSCYIPPSLLAGRFLSAEQTCVLQCPVGSFGSRVNGACEMCARGCVQCQDLQRCQKCQFSRKRKLYLQDGQCVQQCTRSEGFPAGLLCQSCAPDCASCERNATYCLSCVEPLLLHKHQCVENCPTAHMLRDGECQHCPVGCLHCTDNGLCSECEDTHFLIEGHCVVDCPDGFYDDTESGVCGRCHLDCRLCDGPDADECDMCADPEATFHNRACLPPCPSHTYRDGRTAECKHCDGSCLSCSGPHATSCTSCPDGLRPDAHSRCATLTSCPVRHYADREGECHQCHKYCQQCTGPEKSQCLSCSQNHFLLNGTCVNDCPVGTFRDIAQQKCDLCHPSCLSCVGKHSHECLACRPQLFRLGKECVETCPSSDGSTQTCEHCDASCGECMRAGPDSCLSCKEGQLYLRKLGQCHGTCPKSHYQDTHHRTCEPCHPSCKSCFGTEGVQSCDSCHMGYTLSDGMCESQCIMGEYPVFEVKSGYRCEVCDACLECRGPGAQNCTACPDQAILSEGRCLPCCSADALEDSKAQQQECCNCTETRGTTYPIYSIRKSSPGRGYKKLGMQAGSSGRSFHEEQLVDLSERPGARGEDDDDDEDEDEDIVYMGQDGTVYRKFRYGQLNEENDDELEYDDESYSFR
uniref:P/Homo B domain-containing protein n=1 Tax=Denticeps clupeoides TaxID=299321 RepID=A0AAY4DIR2_9TELE